MHNILWPALTFAAGCVCGGAAMHLIFHRGYGDAYVNGYQSGKADGHALGFAQGRQVAEKAAR